MSTLYRDASIVPRTMLNRYIRTYKRFQRYWGTEYVQDENGNSVHVYSNRARNFYIGDRFVTDETTKRFVKGIGMSWDAFLAQDIDGEIETMYFKLKNYSASALVSPSKTAIVNHIESEFTVDDEFSVTIVYGGNLKKYITEHSQRYTYSNSGLTVTPLNIDEIRQVIFDNPWYYIGNSRHVGYNSGGTYDFDLYDGYSDTVVSRVNGKYAPKIPAVDTSSDSELGVLALLGDGSVFEQVGDISSEVISTSASGVTTYKFKIKYKYNGVNTSSAVVSSIRGWCNYYENAQEYKGNIIQAPSTQIDTKLQRVCYNMMIDEDLDLDNPRVSSDELFVKVPSYSFLDSGVSYKTYLKVDALAAMKKSNAVKLITTLLDTGYTVEAKEWWEDVLAILIIVIAVVVGAFLCTTGAGCAASIEVIAYAVGGAGVVLAAGAYLLSEVGGLSSLDNVKILGKFATIVGYASMMLGVTAFLNNMATNAAKEAAVEAASQTSQTFAQKAILMAGEMVDKAINAVTGGLSSAVMKVTNIFTQSATVSIGQVANALLDVMKVALKGFEYYTDQEKKKLDEVKQELQEEEDKYNEDTLTRPYKIGTDVYAVVESRLKDIDMLNDMSAMKENMVGKDKNYSAWLTDVNS